VPLGLLKERPGQSEREFLVREIWNKKFMRYGSVRTKIYPGLPFLLLVVLLLLLLFLFLFFVFVFVRGSSAGEERGGRKEREMLNEKWSLLSHGWSLIRTVFDGMSRCNVLSIAGW